MKKLITIILTLAMLTSLFALSTSAITEADASAWKYTVLMQSSAGLSFTGDDVLFYGKYCMRGMAISQDGKYMFGGYLNPSGSGSIEMFETATGKVISGIQYIQPENSKSSYPKGLATDDRGYLYAALAWNPNNTKADLAVYEYENGLKQISYTNVVTTSETIKTGVNGIAVEQINGMYFAYIVVNYDVDYLVRMNVTDPANPTLDPTFGENGVIDLQKEPYNIKEANYLDVDTDGTIYLACNANEGRVVKVLSTDGTIVLNTFPHETAYGVAIWGDYLFVTTQKTGKVGIYNKSLLTPVASIEVTSDNIVLPIDRDGIVINSGVSSLCNVAVINDILFLGDQADGSSGFDNIFAVGLTAEAAATVEAYSKAIHDRLAAAYPEKTEPEETTKSPDEETTEAPKDETTEAPKDETTNAPKDEQTNAPTTEAPTTEKKGCGGFVAGAAMIVVLLGTAVVLKKRD